MDAIKIGIIKRGSSHQTAPNLLAQDFSAEAMNQTWVADITYILRKSS